MSEFTRPSDSQPHPWPSPTELMAKDATLRDYFAAKALPAVITQCSGDTRRDGEVQTDYFARVSYELADAMLAARSAS